MRNIIPVISISFIIISIIAVYSFVYFGIYSRPHLLIGNCIPIEASNNVVVVQAFDEKYGKKVGFITMKHNIEWCTKNGYSYKYYSKKSPAGEMPHFLRYHAILEILNDNREALVVYIDGDAILSNSKQKLIMCEEADISFGNEFPHMNHWKFLSKSSPINSGYIVVKNTELSKRFLEKMLSSKTCEECRIRGCGKLNFKDQGCLDRLLWSEPQGVIDRFKIADVQSRKPGNLLIHVAGSRNYDKLKNWIKEKK